MSWCRRTAITSICHRITPYLPLQHSFSSTAPVNKKFKPQELYLLPGQPKARKSKVPKKVLAWRARREGLSEAREDESEPVAIFAEETELDRPTPRQDEGLPFGLKKPWLSRAATWHDDYRGSGGGTFGLERRPSGKDGKERFASGETHMAQRIRETRAGLVDLSAQSSTSPNEQSAPPHPDTVIPSWKIPTPTEYERMAYRRAKYQSKLHKEDLKKRPRGRRGAGSPYGQSGATSLSSALRPQLKRNNLSDNDKDGAERDWSDPKQPEPASSDSLKPPVERPFGRWEPTKKLSIPTMQGLRSLHQSDPKTFSHAVLSEKFGVSREAVARIIRSKFRDEQR